MRGRSPWLHTMTQLEEARLCLAHAQDPACLDRARAWAEANPLPADGQLTSEITPNTCCMPGSCCTKRAQTGIAQKREGIFQEGSCSFSPRRARGLVLEASLVYALFEFALGETEHALERVLSCLHQAEPQGYVRAFLDSGAALDGLLSRVPASDPSHAYAQALLARLGSLPACPGQHVRWRSARPGGTPERARAGCPAAPGHPAFEFRNRRSALCRHQHRPVPHQGHLRETRSPHPAGGD